MIKIQLSHEQQHELEDFRRQVSSKDSEKALMVLLNNDGKTVAEIALMLKRHQHTVRDWLKRYRSQGIRGLYRKFSPGRPNDLREKIKEYISKIIKESPLSFGYQDSAWSVPLITFDINRNLPVNTSPKTVTRALKNMGYVYKRPSKTVPGHAPGKREKKEAVKAVVGEILNLIDRKESAVYTLDEAHFSTEPYLVRGWFFKRQPPQDRNAQKKGKPHVLWMFEHKNTKILLEKIS